MKLTNIKDLSYDELKALSMQKNRVGCATKEALQAQYILYKEAGCTFSRNHNPFGIHRGADFVEDFDV